MSKLILISPYSSYIKDGINAKNYPYWDELVKLLINSGHIVHQLNVKGERQIEGALLLSPLELYQIPIILKKYDTFISVDNFFHHLAAFYNFKGNVIFSKSDPLIFGYSIHNNILKSRKYLRHKQFDTWFNVKYNKNAFYKANEIIKLIKI